MAVTTVVIIFVFNGIFGHSTHAETISSLKDKQSKVEKERSEVKKNLSKAEADIADILFDLKELNEEITLVDDALKYNKNMLEETLENIESTEKEVNKLESEIADLEEDIELRNDILKQRLSSLQKNGGKIGYLDVLFGAKSFMDFIGRATALSKIATTDIDLITKQEEDKELVVQKYEKVEEKLSEQQDMKVELEGMQLLIVEQQKENKKKKKTLQKKEKELKTMKAELEDKDSSLASLESQIRRDISAARTPVTVATTDKSSSNNLVHLSSPSPPKGNGSLSTVINAGYRYYGVPYRTAGKTPAGFDCSGFVSWAFAQGGYSIPSSTEGLRLIGQKIDKSQMRPGDLVFFDTYKRDGHVGIYIGNGKFIGSQNTKGLSEASIHDSYWSKRFVGHVRRVR